MSSVEITYKQFHIISCVLHSASFMMSLCFSMEIISPFIGPAGRDADIFFRIYFFRAVSCWDRFGIVARRIDPCRNAVFSSLRYLVTTGRKMDDV